MDDLPPGLVSIPAEDKMWTRSVAAVLNLHAATPRASFAWQVALPGIAMKRNAGVDTMLGEDDFRWILFLDSDMDPPPDTIYRLWQTAEAEGADLVQAAMVKKRPPHQPVGGRMKNRGQPADPLRPFTSDPHKETIFPKGESLLKLSEPLELDVGGTGCLLVRRGVFEDLDPPWFAARDDGACSDVNFTLRATDAGYRLVLEPRVRVGHVSCYSYDLRDAARVEQAHRRQEELEARARRRMDQHGAAVPGGGGRRP